MLLRNAFLLLCALTSAVTVEGGECTGCGYGSFGQCKMNHDSKHCVPYNDGKCVSGTTPCSGGDGEGDEDATGCSNTASEGSQDDGCDEGPNICVYANGGLVEGNNDGDHCATCVNSKRGGGGEDFDARDFGCGTDTPVCVGAGGADLPALVEGERCAVCFNSLDSDDACDFDDGCPPSRPDCALDNGDSPVIWHPGTQCVANCRNTESGGDTDHGCHGTFPICVLDSGSEPSSNGEGDECAPCVNTEASNAATDAGCSDEFPACVAADETQVGDGKAGAQCISISYCPPGSELTKVKFDEDADGKETVNGQYIGDFGTCFKVSVRPFDGGLDTKLPRIYNTNLDGGADEDLELDIGNVLIIQEDNGDNLAPDDNENGGIFILKFSSPTKIQSIGLVDTEERVKFAFFHSSSGRSRINVPGGTVADATSYDAVVDEEDVTQIKISLWGSGGIPYINMCLAECN